MAFEQSIVSLHEVAVRRNRQLRTTILYLVILLSAGFAQQASAFKLFGMEGDWSLSGRYAYQVRAEQQSDGVINTEGREQVPLPEWMKWPNSHNFDDADRSYEQWDPIYNRIILASSLGLEINDRFGFSFSGDAFYDFVYHRSNAYSKPEGAYYSSLNSVGHAPNEFTDKAEDIMGADIRLKNAYFYGTFFFQGMSLDFKIGQMVVAYGQSTFFSGLARAMGAADATRATVPGTDPSKIFIPVMQLSARLRINRKFTLVFNQKFEWTPNQLNPVGTYYSASDVIAPGGDFAFAIKNPLNPRHLNDIQLNPATGRVLDNILKFTNLPPNLLENALRNLQGSGIPNAGEKLVREIVVPALSGIAKNTNIAFPRGFPVIRKDPIKPDQYNMGQWGIGLEYSLSWTTEIGFYHLNYHSKIPLPRQNFGYAAIITQDDGTPILTTDGINPGPAVRVPVTYSLQYFQDIKMNAISFSTLLFGANVAGELVYRNDAPTLAKDPGNALSGPVPTPARSQNVQILLNAVKTFGPTDYWDSLIFVGAVSYIRLLDIEPQHTQVDPDGDGTVGEQTFDELVDLFDKQAAAFATRMMFNYRDVFPGWKMTIPLTISGSIWNRTPMPGAFASQFSQGDYRVGIGATFTHLNKLSIGVNYMAYLGEPDDDRRPLQDRDTLGFFVKYSFF